MERVLGIGGLFFRSEQPDAVARWYAEHLGVTGPGESYDDPVWRQAEGETVFAPFGSEHWDSPHLGPSGWGINFRVADLDAMVAQLRKAGIVVEVDGERYPNGRFAQVHDPDGNPVQLWQHMRPDVRSRSTSKAPLAPINIRAGEQHTRAGSRAGRESGEH